MHWMIARAAGALGLRVETLPPLIEQHCMLTVGLRWIGIAAQRSNGVTLIRCSISPCNLILSGPVPRNKAVTVIATGTRRELSERMAVRTRSIKPPGRKRPGNVVAAL